MGITGWDHPGDVSITGWWVSLAGITGWLVSSGRMEGITRWVSQDGISRSHGGGYHMVVGITWWWVSHGGGYHRVVGIIIAGQGIIIAGCRVLQDGGYHRVVGITGWWVS